ncbi:phage protease [Bacillus cereus group sp. MYBK12-2]|uniref:phage protease n=1 Tax=Bacillus cereus group sp. MYBK12-2 TaxID=3450689 RepID=UPI0032F7BA9E|nr:hypothetical protein [Bacillus pacificus]HDR7653574.1 hypothetical protein [Bacillus pacificus]
MKKTFLCFSEETNSMIQFFNKFAEDVSAEASTIERVEGWIIKNVEIFKIGVYRGQPYTEDDLQQMVDNFQALKGTLFDPVFKKDHSESVEDQIGWIIDVRRDGELLKADIHLTEWQPYEKIRNGTWKYLSSEIYPPELAQEEFGINGYVLRGVAIVSVPKVKGLKGLILNSEILDQEGGDLMDKQQIIAMLAKLGITFSEQEQENLTVEQLEERLTAKFAEQQQQQQPAAGTEPGAATTTQQPAAQPGTGVTVAGNGAAAAFSENQQFVVMTHDQVLALAQNVGQANQQSINLFAEVQKLTQESRQQKIERKINVLMSQGKILPAEKAQIQAFAETLDENATDAYFQTIEKRPAVVTFSEVGGPAGIGGTEDEQETKAAIEAFKEWQQPKRYE